MIVVAYSDRQGRGFTQESPATDVADRRFWRASQLLLENQIQQPPAALRSTGTHPIWGLSVVHVDDQPHWCFSVQGQGGTFGPGGTCRFGFVRTSTPAAEAWVRGRGAVAGVATPSRPTADLRRQVARLIDALAQDRQVVELPCGPATMAGVIESVLYVVPPAVAERYAWHTCLLQRPDITRYVGLVTGRMPDEFAERIATVARAIDSALRTGSAGMGRSMNTGAHGWLVDRAMDRRPAATELSGHHRTMAEMLDDITDRHVAVRPADVADIAATEAGRGRLLRTGNREVLRRWVVENPRTALKGIVAEPRGEFAQVVFGYLADAHREETRRSAAGDGAIGAGIARSAERLGHLIAGYATQRSEDVGDVLTDLVAGAGRTPSGEELDALRPLLRRLGADPAAHPKLVGPSAQAVLAVLRGAGPHEPALRAELGRTGRPVTWLAGQVRAGARFANSAEHLAECLAVAVRLGGNAPASEVLRAMVDGGRLGRDKVETFARRARELSVPLAAYPGMPAWLRPLLSDGSTPAEPTTDPLRPPASVPQVTTQRRPGAGASRPTPPSGLLTRWARQLLRPRAHQDGPAGSWPAADQRPDGDQAP